MDLRMYSDVLPIVWAGALISALITAVLIIVHQRSKTYVSAVIAWISGITSVLFLAIFSVLEARISPMLMLSGILTGLGFLLGFVCAHLLTIRKFALAAVVFVIALLPVVGGFLLAGRYPIPTYPPQSIGWTTIH